MPAYVHKCKKEECEHEQDELYSIKDFDQNKVTTCKKCGEPTAERIISGLPTAHYSWKSWQS